MRETTILERLQKYADRVGFQDQDVAFVKELLLAERRDGYMSGVKAALEEAIIAVRISGGDKSVQERIRSLEERFQANAGKE